MNNSFETYLKIIRDESCFYEIFSCHDTVRKFQEFAFIILPQKFREIDLYSTDFWNTLTVRAQCGKIHCRNCDNLPFIYEFLSKNYVKSTHLQNYIASCFHGKIFRQIKWKINCTKFFGKKIVRVKEISTRYRKLLLVFTKYFKW